MTPMCVVCQEGKNLPFFWAEWQTSLEQAGFNIGKIGGRVFAKAPLLSATFLALLYLSPQVTPALIIPGL